jgi:hypothetical protein
MESVHVTALAAFAMVGVFFAAISWLIGKVVRRLAALELRIEIERQRAARTSTE